MNGHLPSIHDAFTNDFINGQTGNNFHDSVAKDFWIGLNTHTEQGKWSWTDNSTFNYNDWATSEPQNSSTICAAVVITTGLWKTYECSQSKSFVCVLSSIVTATTNTVPVNCTPGWTYFDSTHSCYGIGDTPYFHTTWTDGEEYCISKNAHLVSFHSLDEVQFIENLMITAVISQAWVGLYSNDNELAFLKTWHWTDKSATDYLPWYPENPRLNVSSCAEIWTLKLHDYPCTHKRNFICKKAATSNSELSNQNNL